MLLQIYQVKLVAAAIGTQVTTAIHCCKPDSSVAEEHSCSSTFEVAVAAGPFLAGIFATERKDLTATTTDSVDQQLVNPKDDFRRVLDPYYCCS